MTEGPRVPDESLRRRALDALGPLAPSLAHEAVETGRVEIERAVRTWQGSLGEVEAHRVVLVVEARLAERVQASPAVLDALTAAFANVIAHVAGQALFELEVAAGTGATGGTPYR